MAGTRRTTFCRVADWIELMNNSIVFCSPAKSLTFSGFMEHPLVGAWRLNLSTPQPKHSLLIAPHAQKDKHAHICTRACLCWSCLPFFGGLNWQKRKEQPLRHVETQQKERQISVSSNKASPFLRANFHCPVQRSWIGPTSWASWLRFFFLRGGGGKRRGGHR